MNIFEFVHRLRARLAGAKWLGCLPTLKKCEAKTRYFLAFGGASGRPSSPAERGAGGRVLATPGGIVGRLRRNVSSDN